MITEKLSTIQDTRAANKSNSISDVMMSGLACMYFQSVSLVEFQQRMEHKTQRNNLRSMFSVQNLPTDQGMRNVIDQVDTETAFRPIFLIITICCGRKSDINPSKSCKTLKY